MRGCKSPEDPSPFHRLNQMGGDWDIIFDENELLSWLTNLAHMHYLSDQDLKFFGSLHAAIIGCHPSVRVKIEQIPDDVLPRLRQEWRRESIARAVADHVDQQVAEGVKQESAVQEASERYFVSRREIFRMLREVRALRLKWQEWDNPYDDYEIAEDGRLVPKDNSG